jgi:hypothetical protein
LVFGQGTYYIAQPTGFSHGVAFGRYMNNLHSLIFLIGLLQAPENIPDDAWVAVTGKLG